MATQADERRLTFGTLKAAVVADGAEELKDEDGHRNYRQAHDKHHHPHSRTVRLWKGKQENMGV